MYQTMARYHKRGNRTMNVNDIFWMSTVATWPIKWSQRDFGRWKSKARFRRSASALLGKRIESRRALHFYIGKQMSPQQQIRFTCPPIFCDVFTLFCYYVGLWHCCHQQCRVKALYNETDSRLKRVAHVLRYFAVESRCFSPSNIFFVLQPLIRQRRLTCNTLVKAMVLIVSTIKCSYTARFQ